MKFTKPDILTAARPKSSNQGSGSTAVRRHINVLRSAVLSNRRQLEKLNAAEETAKQSTPVETESTTYDEGSAIEEKQALDSFQIEFKVANSPPETSIILASSDATDRRNQLLRVFAGFRHDLPASTVISSSLPPSVT